MPGARAGDVVRGVKVPIDAPVFESHTGSQCDSPQKRSVMKRLSIAALLIPLALVLVSCADDVQSQTRNAPGPEVLEPNANVPVSKDVPYVPTPQETVDEMLRLAGVDSDDLVYDLGSGDGRIVITAAKEHGARGVGIDIDPQRIADANENAERAKVTDRVRFIRGDLFDADLSQADAVTLYLLPSVNLRLRPKLLEELRPGTPVVSHDFDMGDWEPDDKVEVGHDDLFLWIIPAKVDGMWQWNGPDGRPLTAKFEQEFQKFSGTAREGPRALVIRNGRIRGDEISFDLADGSGGDARVVGRYNGRASGNGIRGTAELSDGRRVQWLARQ